MNCYIRQIYTAILLHAGRITKINNVLMVEYKIKIPELYITFRYFRDKYIIDDRIPMNSNWLIGPIRLDNRYENVEVEMHKVIA